MMQLAIHLSARNVQEETGGPFGSAIFERNLKTNEAKLILVGVNRVVVLSNSTLHGETVAIQLAVIVALFHTYLRSQCRYVWSSSYFK